MLARVGPTRKFRAKFRDVPRVLRLRHPKLNQRLPRLGLVVRQLLDAGDYEHPDDHRDLNAVPRRDTNHPLGPERGQIDKDQLSPIDRAHWKPDSEVADA